MFFFRVYRGVSRGAAVAKNTKLSWCKVFLALHLILGGKSHICGRDDLFCSSNSLFNHVTYHTRKFRGLI